MALSPLPTTEVVYESKPDAQAFPYREIDKGEPSRSSNEDIELSPLLGAKLPKKVEEPVVSEAQRMNELENMLSEAQNRAAVIEQEAYDKAYAAGEKSGLALGEKRAQQILETMQDIVVQAESELKHLQTQSVTVVLEIAQTVIEHVMGTSDEHIQKALEHSVNKALDQFLLGFNERLELSVNPQDLNMFSRMTKLPEGSKLKGSPDVKEGTCRLISSGQDILIDPKQVIQDSLEHIQDQLVKDG